MSRPALLRTLVLVAAVLLGMVSAARLDIYVDPSKCAGIIRDLRMEILQHYVDAQLAAKLDRELADLQERGSRRLFSTGIGLLWDVNSIFAAEANDRHLRMG